MFFLLQIKYKEKDSSADFNSYDIGDVTSFLITNLKTNAKYEVQLISYGDEQVLPSPPGVITIRTDPDGTLLGLAVCPVHKLMQVYSKTPIKEHVILDPG